MKKLAAGLIMMLFISAAFVVGCGSTTPTGPAATPTKTATPVNTATPTATSQPVQAAVVLGTAGTYAVLSGQSITSTGATTLCGDLGLYPGTSVTGVPYQACSGVPGGAYNVGPANVPASIAHNDLVTAYADVTGAGRGTGSLVTGVIGNQTFYPGLYYSLTTLGVSGPLTLDGQNTANPVFIFKAGSTLTTASQVTVGVPASQIVLINGATAAKVFWAVGTDCTIGTYSIFKGIIMTQGNLSILTGAAIEGRALAEVPGTLTLDTNIITNP